VLGEIQEYEYDDDLRGPKGNWSSPYPAAVSLELWQAANDALAGRRSPPGRKGESFVNLLQGLAICQCGAPMRIRVKGNRNDYTYYQCRDAKRDLCQHKGYINYRPAEALVLRNFGTIAHGLDVPDASVSLALVAKIADKRAALGEIGGSRPEPGRRNAVRAADRAPSAVAGRSGPGLASGADGRSPAARSAGRAGVAHWRGKPLARRRPRRSIRWPARVPRPLQSRHAVGGCQRDARQRRNFFWMSMTASARARRCVRRALFRCKAATSAASGLGPAVFGPRLPGTSALKAPASRCRRHSLRVDE
jgi:hypothetical protein